MSGDIDNPLEFGVEAQELQAFSLEEISFGLGQGLQEHFDHVAVSIEECPNMLQTPYQLSYKGFGEDLRIVDLGGPPYLLPLVNKSKLYDLSKIIPQYVSNRDYDDGWAVGGAGAGPWPKINSNCEMMLNFYMNKDGSLRDNNSMISYLEKSEQSVKTLRLDESESRCGLLSNFFVSKDYGQVIKIWCKSRRYGSPSFTSSIRSVLTSKYPNCCIGLGGVFTVDSSPVCIHVMRDFPEEPLETDEAVNKWLYFRTVSKKMLFQSVVVSHDPGLDLRMEHSHGWDTVDESVAGHYHYDIVGSSVVYEGYYGLAKEIIRIDRPDSSHDLGRD